MSLSIEFLDYTCQSKKSAALGRLPGVLAFEEGVRAAAAGVSVGVFLPADGAAPRVVGKLKPCLRVGVGVAAALGVVDALGVIAALLGVAAGLLGVIAALLGVVDALGVAPSFTAAAALGPPVAGAGLFGGSRGVAALTSPFAARLVPVKGVEAFVGVLEMVRPNATLGVAEAGLSAEAGRLSAEPRGGVLDAGRGDVLAATSTLARAAAGAAAFFWSKTTVVLLLSANLTRFFD